MDDAHDIPDSTDWLSTPLSALSKLESSLHCQICKEFFDTPMITSCNHTFCSRCIRTAISADGQCPTCRAQDAPSKLRNNWQLQEVVAAFLEARPSTLKVAQDYQSVMSTEHKRPGKRKRTEGDPAESTSRTTRSKSRRLESTQSSQQDTLDLEEVEDDVQIIEQPIIDDGLVECPLGCGRRMKVEEVEPHLDKCEDERQAREKAARAKKEPIKSRPQDRLNELSYGMMKESQIAKKLRELGLRTNGNKQLLVRRHTAWVNMWNANCDSSRPKTKQELLRELDIWERTQGGNAPMVTSSIMKKDFDGDGWSRKNQDSFADLIANARKSKARAAEKKDEQADGDTARESELADAADTTGATNDTQQTASEHVLQGQAGLNSEAVLDVSDTQLPQPDPVVATVASSTSHLTEPPNIDLGAPQDSAFGADALEPECGLDATTTKPSPAKRMPYFAV